MMMMTLGFDDDDNPGGYPAGPGSMEGDCQPVLALSVLIVTSLHSFSFSFSPEVFSIAVAP